MAASDISPKLLERLQAAFDRNLYSNKKAASLLEKINAGNATYADAGNYAEQVGMSLARALESELKPSALPDGKMYWNIAEKAVKPLYEQEFNMTASAATTVQKTLNKKANIGLRAQTATLDEDALKSILNMFCAADYAANNAELFNTPESYARAGVDETLKANADFQYKCGRRPRIIRRAGVGCCKWCADREGVYDYPKVPDEVYRRHDYCRCAVDYDPGNSDRKVQDVWDKDTWRTEEEAEKLEERKTYNVARKYDTNGKKFKWDNGSRVETRKNGKTLAK